MCYFIAASFYWWGSQSACRKPSLSIRIQTKSQVYLHEWGSISQPQCHWLVITSFTTKTTLPHWEIGLFFSECKYNSCFLPIFYFFPQVFDYEEEVRKPLQDDSDSDDDISSYHDNSDSSGEEEETERKQKMGDLEWDDSTMSI